MWRITVEKLQSDCHLDTGEKIQDSLGSKVSFIKPLNPAEPLLIISSNGEAALHSLLQDPKGNEAHDKDDLSHDAVEDVDLDTELLSWLFRAAVKVHHDIKACSGLCWWR